MNKIVDAEIKTGNAGQVFASLDGCDNFCINAAVIREERRFLMRNKQLFGVFEVVGLNGNPQSFWAATAILPSGYPVPMAEGAHKARCEEMTPA